MEQLRCPFLSPFLTSLAVQEVGVGVGASGALEDTPCPGCPPAPQQPARGFDSGHNPGKDPLHHHVWGRLVAWRELAPVVEDRFPFLVAVGRGDAGSSLLPQGMWGIN